MEVVNELVLLGYGGLEACLLQGPYTVCGLLLPEGKVHLGQLGLPLSTLLHQLAVRCLEDVVLPANGAHLHGEEGEGRGKRGG